MKKRIWANPEKQWEGFRFAAYSLDSKKIWALPLVKKPAKEQTEQTSTTVGDVYESLVNQHFEIEPFSILGVRVTTDTEKLEFKGPQFNCDVLGELLRLTKDGINPFSAQWFWYDEDSCRDEPNEIYSFFVVYQDKIVSERVSFSDYHGNGFDPDIFKWDEGHDDIWRNDSDWMEATTRLWYRRFYSETRTGQLMVLRPDEPILYHYPRTQALDGMSGSQVPEVAVRSQDKPPTVTLLRTYKLLWIAIPLLAAIAFPSSKDFMGPVAIALLLDFLWVCWQTRTK
jgi:hypothetical protein